MLDRPMQRFSGSNNHFDQDTDRLRPEAAANAIWLLARCLIGGLFLQSGTGKLMGLDAFAAGLAKNGVPMPDIAATIGATVEFCGGLAIVIGLQTRYAALLMVAFTIVATLISHRFWELAEPAARRQQAVQFGKNIAIIGGFLLLFVQGGGRYSVDGWRRHTRSPD
jgi:putative oxidoreductase